MIYRHKQTGRVIEIVSELISPDWVMSLSQPYNENNQEYV